MIGLREAIDPYSQILTRCTDNFVMISADIIYRSLALIGYRNGDFKPSYRGLNDKVIEAIIPCRDPYDNGQIRSIQ